MRLLCERITELFSKLPVDLRAFYHYNDHNTIMFMEYLNDDAVPSLLA